MNVVGVIAEYNPFHNGHKYLIEEAKKKANAEFAVSIMSGNFTQRGETSVIDKFEKAKIAANNGVDLVIELPTIYSISSAENFAEGGVKILENLGIVTHIAFGIEEESLSELKQIAEILENEPEEFSKILQEELKKGCSFPNARENAIIKYTKNEKYGEIISKPNNILAIEYLKALKKLNSKIIPIGIKRKNVGYNDNNIVNNFASSSKIRELLKKYFENDLMKNNKLNSENENYNKINNNMEKKYNEINNENNIKDDISNSQSNFENEQIKDVVEIKNKKIELEKEIEKCIPKASFEILNDNIENGDVVVDLNEFSDMILYKLRTINTEEIKNIPDVNEGLENVIKGASNTTNNLEDLIEKCKSKRYTRTRIQRILVCALLGITKKDIEISKNEIPYTRVLAVSENGKKLLPYIKSVPNLIISLKKFEDENKNENLKRILDLDKKTTAIYSIKQSTNTFSNKDYTNKI